MNTICKSCLSSLPADANFCHNCGKSAIIISNGNDNNITKSQHHNTQAENFHVLKSVGETLSPEETVKWLKKFRKGQKKGTWIFFGAVAVIVLIVIIFNAEDFKTGAIGFLFFFVVFFLLAFFTRRRANQNWIGVVKNKKVIKTKRYSSQDDAGTTVLEPMLYFKLKSGSKKLSVTNEMYNYFNEGDKVFKISGTEYPELQELTLKGRVCIVCGTILPTRHKLKCKKCKSPVPDFITLLKEASLQ